MTSVKKLDPFNWYSICEEHEYKWCSDDWETALLMAYGHAAMDHKKPKPLLDITISDGTYTVEVSGLAQ